MATIVDYQIQSHSTGSGLIVPFNLRQLNPASYDVTLGKSIKVEDINGEWKEQDLPYDLEPGEFILGVTNEWFSLPDNMEAQFQLKSSRGREGYEHVLSGYVDPGYSGRLTLELLNVRRHKKLPLREGMLIGQVRFMFTDKVCRESYKTKGHYMYDEGAQPSKTGIFG